MDQPPGLDEVIKAQQLQDCPCRGRGGKKFQQCERCCPHIASAVEAGWCAALNRIQYLQAQGIKVVLGPGSYLGG